MVKIDRVYTKAGDTGQTALVGAAGVSKASSRIESYGTVDELNATIGMARAELADSPAQAELDPILARVQGQLFDLGGELATPEPKRLEGRPLVDDDEVRALEVDLDRFNDELPELTSFILPGGSRSAATLHLARTVCRRAERRVVALASEEALRPQVVVYLNRLSDALFVFARYASVADGATEHLWTPGGS